MNQFLTKQAQKVTSKSLKKARYSSLAMTKKIKKFETLERR